MLDKQISLFKIDTDAFLSKEEKLHREYLRKAKRVKKHCLDLSSNKNKPESLREHASSWVKKLTPFIKETEKEYKKWLLQSASDAVEYNKNNPDNLHIRELDENYLYYTNKKTGEKTINLTNIISMFESTLSRSFNIATNEITYDIFVLEIYYYDIAKDLILNGFNYKGNHYVYFSSSAGQIRTKKAVFVNEEKFKKCEMKLTCGLTLDKINAQGGMNVNKYLAYIALCNSATELWETIFNKPFDIDRCIVVNDFETLVKTKVDYIDYTTYKIEENKKMDVPIPHTDGCGIIDSNICEKNFMVRAPFVKGLLGSFNYKRFIIENDLSGDVYDYWGKKYNIFDDDIQIIMTASMLKTIKYFKSWDEYKENFKKYNCEFCICNMEEDKIPNATINYQMLQTLHDMTDEEIEELCEYSNKKIETITDSLENAMRFYGVDIYDTERDDDSYFKKALRIYPELMNTPSNRSDLRDLKNSLVKRYRGGHLEVMGKFTFVLPDLYAFCEWLFEGTEVPVGLLEGDEVFCRLYKNAKELDCLRSPHLAEEHKIMKNVCSKKFRHQRLDEWFQTDAVYTSSKSAISKILQFDVDGDRLLVVAQKKFIEIAKRNAEGFNPLYYEMKKANAQVITPEVKWEGLEAAFKGGKIGGISNDITKIWNTENIDKQAKDAVKLLCMEVNFTIDYAKTLFKPTRPDDIDKMLKEYTHTKVPAFFMYAKDKSVTQCEETNNSTMNRISRAIKDNKLMFKRIKNLEQVDYTLLIKNKYVYDINIDVQKYFEQWNQKYGDVLTYKEDFKNIDSSNIASIAKQIKKELSEFEKDEDVILCTLVRTFYEKPTTRKKKLLWYIYGEQLYNNLVENLSDETRSICWGCGKRTDEKLFRNRCFECRQKDLKLRKGHTLIRCEGCGKEFEVGVKATKRKYCDECQKIRNKLKNAKYNKKRVK